MSGSRAIEVYVAVPLVCPLCGWQLVPSRRDGVETVRCVNRGCDLCDVELERPRLATRVMEPLQ